MISSFLFLPPSKFGSCCKGGKMYIFGPKSITVIRAWPPAAYRKSADNPTWRCIGMKEFYVMPNEILIKDSEAGTEHKHRCLELIFDGSGRS